MKIKKSVTLKANCFLYFLSDLLVALHHALQSIFKKRYQEIVRYIHISPLLEGRYVTNY